MTDPVMTDPAIRIAQQLPCIACGYELRSLRLDECCPECGSPCTDSLASPTLYCDAHVRRLRTGALLAGFASVQLPVVYVLALTMFFLVAFLGIRPSRNAAEVFGLMAVTLAGSGPILAAIGWFRITTKPAAVALPNGEVFLPTYRPPNPAFTPLALIYAGCGCVAIVLGWIAIASDANPLVRVGRWVPTLLIGFAALVWSGRMLIGLPYLAEQCRVAGRRSAITACKVMRWMLIAGAAAMIPGLWLTLILQHTQTYPKLEPVASILLSITAASIVFVSLGNAAYQFGLRKALHNARRFARARTGPVFQLAEPPPTSTAP